MRKIWPLKACVRFTLHYCCGGPASGTCFPGIVRICDPARRLASCLSSPPGCHCSPAGCRCVLAPLQACRLDQGNLISVERFAASVEDWLGGDPLDTLINNAGLGSKTVEGYAGLNRAMVGESDVSAKAGHSKEAAWRLKAAQDEALMRVNGLGPLWVTEALLPFLLPSHPGDGEGQGEGQGVGHLSRRPVVIFTGSVGGSSQSTFPGFRAADGMSKAAITYAVKMLAAEHVHSNITITCVCPGATLTSMFKSSTLDRMADPDKFVAALPQGRCIRPSELASTALWLATDPASRLFHGAILDASQGLAVRPGVLTEYQP